MLIQELRIGNLVNSVLTDETYIIDIWALRTIEDGNYQNGHNTAKKVFKPILLTEEWLIKFGFKIYGKDDMPNSPSDWNWGKIGFNISLTYETKKVQYTNINLEYVHQLQNLYFALTNKELIIKSE